MATLGVAADGEAWIFVKGAPERLMEMSAAQLSSAGTAEPVDPTLWTDAVADAASRGERVLGFAAKRVPTDQERLSFADLEEGLVFLGIVGFIDPPREEATAARSEEHTSALQSLMRLSYAVF